MGRAAEEVNGDRYSISRLSRKENKAIRRDGVGECVEAEEERVKYREPATGGPPRENYLAERDTCNEVMKGHGVSLSQPSTS